MTTRTQTGKFRCQERELAYRLYGEGSRVTVLLHGLLLSQRMHAPLADALADRGNRVVTLDLWGTASPTGRRTCGATRWASSPRR